MADEIIAPAPAGVEAVTAAQFKELSERVAKTADGDLKTFLGGILKATEATLADLQTVREKLDKAQAKADEAAAAVEKTKVETKASAAKASVKAAAEKAGAVVAADVLPFIKLDDVKVDEDGESNVAALVADLKKAKPHLFKAAGSTSSTSASPKPGETQAKTALEMTKAEYLAAKAKITRR